MWWFWARVVLGGAIAAPPPAQAVPSTAGKAEHVPSRTNADPPPPPPGPPVALYDEDVVRALEERQPSFLRCFRIAQRDDLMLASARVALKVKVGSTGAVDEATAEGGPAKLDACVEGVAKRLAFPAPEQSVEASLTLFFQ